MAATAPGRNVWRSLGINVLGGLSAFFIAQGLVGAVQYFFVVPGGVATAVFVTSYSGLVVVFVIRIWEDAKELTEDLRIVIVPHDQFNLPGDSSPTQLQPTLFDQETYEKFQKLLCSLPREYTVVKLNRLFFLDRLQLLPDPEMQEVVKDHKAFSQLLGCLRSDGWIRTDGFSFSVQPLQWEDCRQELRTQPGEMSQWQNLAQRMIGGEVQV